MRACKRILKSPMVHEIDKVNLCPEYTITNMICHALPMNWAQAQKAPTQMSNGTTETDYHKFWISYHSKPFPSSKEKLFVPLIASHFLLFTYPGSRTGVPLLIYFFAFFIAFLESCLKDVS